MALDTRPARGLDGRAVTDDRPSLLWPALLAGAAFAVAAATRGGRGRALDDRVYKAVNSAHRPWLDAGMRGLTELGSIYASAGAAAAIAAGGRRREAADAMAAAGAAWLLGQGIKKAYRRARPFDSEYPGRLVIGKPRGTSWPSSHPMVLLTFADVAARNLGLGRGARRGLEGLAGLVAASRVYLGVHYPSDVAGGLLLGRALSGLWGRFVSPRFRR